MEFKEIEYTKSDGIATITLNRPQALNAFTMTMIHEWIAAIEAAQRDDEVRVLVVTGAGRGFCSGIDLKGAESPGNPGERRRAMWDVVQAMPRAIVKFDKPYIASINGPAVGAGMDNCSFADFRIASDRAKFACNHLRIAAISVDGGYYHLTRILGVAKALELVMKWDIFDAAEALRIGYVNSVVPHDDLAAATHELASRLAAGPPISMRFAKRLIYEAPNVSMEQHLNDLLKAMDVIGATEDSIEGPRAVLEKRPARFKGR